MNTKRFPVFATLLVVAAVAVMVGLGVWQLGRSQEKEALLARYEESRGAQAPVPWPVTEAEVERALYRQSRLLCMRVVERGAMAGRNASAEAGLAQYVECLVPDGSRARVVLGWSRDPGLKTVWNGGEVAGVIAPGPRLVADPPLAGLEPNEIPDPAELPNNHLGYAIQWFFFAAAAIVIYIIALRRRTSG
ncbi:SURF1 family cytochrome oxidase biogenesis protein [Novosphingobium rhizovicinum]|uniref:SURF1-like protein n=1 Tax=Novosphingobium rhizovicinum TaxID=3228928 RepID=A0ABV3RDZ6_9SPHN